LEEAPPEAASFDPAPSPIPQRNRKFCNGDAIIVP